MEKGELHEHHQKALNMAAAELNREQQRINKYIKAHQKNTQEIVASLSYKIGYLFTYPLRLILNGLKGKSTPLFHQLKPSAYFLESYNKNITSIQGTITNKTGPTFLGASHNIQGYIDGLNKGILKGWYRDSTNSLNRLELQLYHKNKKIGYTTCDIYRKDLAQNNIGDGHYGFELNFKEFQKEYKGEIELMVKNGPSLGTYLISDNSIQTIHLEDLKNGQGLGSGNHEKYDFTFEGIKNDLVCGWIVNLNQPENKVKVHLFWGNEFVKSGVANIHRSDVEFVGKGDGKCGFEIKIPYEKLIRNSGVFKVVTDDGAYLGEAEWNAFLYKKQLTIHPFKPNQTMYLPIDDGISELALEAFDFKVAIHIHVFYVDVFEDICMYLNNIPGNFTLLISTSQNNQADIESLILKNNFEGKVVIKKVINRGRDIAPMIVDFGEELLACDLALHMHTKKTAHNKNLGELWMHHILKCLLSDELYLNNIFKLFKSDPKLGIIAPTVIDDLERFYNWGENHQRAISLFKEVGVHKKWLPNEEEPIEFPAGTMFWFRPAALKKLLRSPLKYTSFPKEPIEADGTIAHAIERCVYYLAQENSYAYLTVEPLKPKPVLLDETIKISIIIPVYNAKKWLPDAVQSILTQKTFLAVYEIILVDNNSTDGSDELCKQFEYVYPQIHYFKETKKGAGNARNLGLKKAKGTYVFFLDADDLIGNHSLQALLDKAVYSEAELVVSPLVIFDELGFKEASPYKFTQFQNTLAMGELKKRAADSIEEQLLYDLFSDFGPCAKLYKRSFLEENKLFFPENTNYEDNIFIYSVYFKAGKIAICGTPTYYYRKFIEEKGTTQSTTSDENSLIDQCSIIKQLQELAKQKKAKNLSRFAHAGFVKKLFWFFNVLDSLPETKSAFYPSLNEILTEIPQNIIEQEGRQYVNFFKTMLKEDYTKAKSVFLSTK